MKILGVEIEKAKEKRKVENLLINCFDSSVLRLFSKKGKYKIQKYEPFNVFEVNY